MQQWPTQTQAEDCSELHTEQSRSRSVLSRDLRRCRLSLFSCACLNPWRGLVQGRLPKCISSHCPMHHQCSRMATWTLDTRAPDNKPVPVNFPTKSCDQGLRITNAPGANILSRRLFVEIKNVLLIIPYTNPTVAAQRQAHKRAVFSPSAKEILIAAQTKNKLLSRIKCHITENIYYNSFHLASFFPAPPFSDRVAHGVSISTPQRQHH